MVDFNSVVQSLTSKLGSKIESSDKLKEMVSNLGDKFTEKVQSGNFAEGSIFDAASKLGINSKDDLKDLFAQFKADPKATMGDTFAKLKDTDFFKAFDDEHIRASFQKAAGMNGQDSTADGASQQTAGADNSASKPQSKYTDAEGKQLMREAAKKFHPDNGGSNEMMAKVNELFANKDYDSLANLLNKKDVNIEA